MGNFSKETEEEIKRTVALGEKLNSPFVSKRSELLAFLDWHYEDDIADQKTKETIVDTYLSKS